MKKVICLILAILTAFSLASAASAAGYTIPEKMQRQLQVGSGLKGSFVIHANADPELSPMIAAVQNAEYEIRGICSGEDLHYYIYQPGEGESITSLTEYYRAGGTDYIRSDFWPEAAYKLPEFETIVNSLLKADGENPSILPELIQMIWDRSQNEEEGGLDTDAFEKQIEVWISAFSAETTVESSEGSSPRLSQVFRIPVEALYNTVAELVKTISENAEVTEMLRSVLTEEQAEIYLNPNLGYFYLEAMENLELDGEIVFSRTMSTLGELIRNMLILPLDASKTGYSSVTIQNDEVQKSILLTGPKGLFFLELPVETDFTADEYEGETIRLIHIDAEDPDARNLALKFTVTKTHEKYEEEEESRNHETDRYTVQVVRDASALPEGYSSDSIADMEPIEADLELHYYSKQQLSSPTTLEVSWSIRQGQYHFTLTGKVKTASPWTFTPFEVSNALNTDGFLKEDFENLKDVWVSQAKERFVRTPEDIKPAEPEEIPEAETGQSVEEASDETTEEATDGAEEVEVIEEGYETETE